MRTIRRRLGPAVLAWNWREAGKVALATSTVSALVWGGGAMAMVVTMGVVAAGAGLSEPYTTFNAYLRSILGLNFVGVGVFFIAAGALWAGLFALVLGMTPREAVLDRAMARAVAAAPVQTVLPMLIWAPLRVLASAREPGFGIVAGKPRWLLDAGWISWAGSAWALLALVVAVGVGLMGVGARFRRARRGSNCPWCDYPRSGLSGGGRCPECGLDPVGPAGSVGSRTGSGA
ncbi:MAG: hypothetical protein IT436_04230 [Phycisphaerales bacterium]|nr:hypothetical protein [Phycisphaerales bacterium]